MRRSELPARGLVTDPNALDGVVHARYAPPEALAPVVELFWYVRWSLPEGVVREQEVIPHPNVNITFERSVVDGREETRGEVVGVVTSRFVRRLAGEGVVFGIKLRAGCVQALDALATSAHGFTDAVIPVASRFAQGAAWTEEMLAALDGPRAAGHDAARAAACAQCAAAQLDGAARLDPQSRRARDLVEHVATTPTLLRVEDLAAWGGVSVRTLQRLFRERVGVRPKWVIRRYRMHEALARMRAGDPPDWADLAASLGYFDQAHFARDVRATVGLTPTQLYQRGPS